MKSSEAKRTKGNQDSGCHAKALDLSALTPPPADMSTQRPDKKRLISRLNRIEGQVRGIARMVNEDRYCVDILDQLAALRAAFDGVAMKLLEDHAQGCVMKAIQAGEGEAAIEELMDVIRKIKA